MTEPSSGVVVIDKPPGWTSHQVVGRLRRLLGTRKVGHAGTLDPMATGVLLIGVNRATRLLGHLAGEDKTYVATIRLGQASSTDDAEGELGSIRPATAVTDQAIEQAMAHLRGEILQRPSSVSAIKVNGQRAYALVRKGEQVELKQRPVTVSDFTVVARHQRGDFCDLEVTVTCSSGTYIRALARDLGEALTVDAASVGGHLTALRRTRIGGFDLPDPAPDLAADQPPKLLGMVEVARRCFPVLELDDAQATDVRYGRGLDLQVTITTALIHGDELLALHQPDLERPGRSKPVAVLVG